MEIKITIIGAGVIGLAIASALSSNHKGVFLLEKNNSYGQETSSRNSEVIHAGIYYPYGSLKARMCVAGNKILYDLLSSKKIPYRQCGKIIVATNHHEEGQLHIIEKKARENGVDDIRTVTQKEIYAMEPNVKAVSALLSPSTGIVDSHRLMRYFMANAKNNGVNMIFQTKVERIIPKKNNAYEVHVIYPDGNTDKFNTQYVINCAGLESDRIAGSIGIDVKANRYSLHYWKGEYFSLEADPGFVKHLIYPVPPEENIGLGIHTTLDLGGRIKIGPNTIYLPDKNYDYTVEKYHLDHFFNAVKRYLPSVQKKDLNPEMAGIRPKLIKPGEGERDFIIREETENGLPGVINLIGIESPGLTAAMAIANYVKQFI